MSVVDQPVVVRCTSTRSNAKNGGADAPHGLFAALSGAVLRAQETPRAWRFNNDLMAITRLARLNSCTSFVAYSRPTLTLSGR